MTLQQWRALPDTQGFYCMKNTWDSLRRKRKTGGSSTAKKKEFNMHERKGECVCMCMCQSVWVSVFMRPMLISHTAFPFLLFWTNHLPVLCQLALCSSTKDFFLKAILMHVHFSCCKRCIKMLWSVKCASLPSLSHHYFARPRTHPPL